MLEGALKVFAGSSNPELTRRICENLDIPLGDATLTRFSDGELYVEIGENVRNADIFVVQSTSSPANDHIMELVIMIDALKRSSASSICAVIPYYGYGRQDRKVAPRTPITAKLVCDLIEAAGATRILAIDLHAGQIQGFFDIPFDHLFAMPVLLQDMWANHPAEETVLVSPDAGGVERARSFAKRIKAGLAIIDKRRLSPDEAAVMHIIGDVKDKNIIIVDDMIDTAGTLVKAAEALKNAGAKDIYSAAAHGIFAGDAYNKIEDSVVIEIVVTNSIYHDKLGTKKIKVLSIGRLLADAILRIHKGWSVSHLFE